MLKLPPKRILDLLAYGALGLVGLAIAFRLSQEYLGFFSYLGLTREQVLQVRNKMDKSYQILSRTRGKLPLGDGIFERGVYIGNGYPLYHRFEWKNDGSASYEIYPLLMELWNTNKDILGLTGTKIV